MEDLSREPSKRPDPPARISAPLARYRLSQAALHLGAFTISELADLTQIPANTVYSFVSELGPQRLRSEPIGLPAPGRPRKRYSLTEQGIAYLLDQSLEVAKLLRDQRVGEPVKPHADVFRIGADIHIRGEVYSSRDIEVEGRVEGSIELGQHDVLIGRRGEVHANIVGRVVTVEGKVVGNIFAQRRVVLRSSGAVKGDVTAPEVILEEGASLVGSVFHSAPAEVTFPTLTTEEEIQAGDELKLPASSKASAR
jgi:cytoskeletal protein CcmA (bactofilin family)